jgi:type IV secretion system protein VirD4
MLWFRASRRSKQERDIRKERSFLGRFFYALKVSSASPFLSYMKNPFKKSVTTHGSAGWLPLGKAVPRNFLHPSGFLLGDWKRGLICPVYYPGSSNILTVAPPRSGKGSMSLIPNALRLDHLFINDVGGEISAVCIKRWREQGYDLFCLNPWNMHAGEPWLLPAHGVNPLQLNDPKSRTFASDCQKLASMLITRTGHEHEPHWIDKGENGDKCLMMYVRKHEPPEKQNLVSVRRHITGTPAQWETLIKNMQASDEEAIRNQGNEWSRMNAQKENREWSSILSVMERSTAWIEDEVIRDCLQSHDVDFDALKRGKGAVISVIVPLEYAKTHAAFSRIMIGCGLLVMSRRPLAKKRVFMMLDEYGALGHVKMVDEALVTMGKYRLSIQLVVHMLEQLKIPGKGWAEIEGACEVRQYLAAWDNETAEHVSRQSGTATVETQTVTGNRVTKNYTDRRLITPEEVQQLHYEKQIVFVGNARPMLLRARPYWERPLLRGTYHPNPFFGESNPGKKIYWPVELIAGAATRVASWFMGPTKTVIALAALLVMAGVSESGIRVQSVVYRGERYCQYQTVTGKVWWTFDSGSCGFLKIRDEFYG